MRWTFVNCEDKIKDLVAKLEEGYKVFVVFKNGKYFGVIPENILIRISLNPEEKIEHYAIRVRPVSENYDIKEVINLLVSTGARAIPITNEKGEIKGVVTVEDILNKIKEEEYFYRRKVRDVMTDEIVSINWKDKVTKALILMKRRGVSRLLVVDDDEKPIGLVTIGDIVRKIVFEKRKERFGEFLDNPFAVEVRSVMSPELYTVEQDASLKKAVDIMLDKDISSLVVTRKDKVVGIVTYKDILADYLAHLKLVNYSIVVHGIHLDEEDRKWIAEKFERRLLRKYKDIIGEDPILVLHIKPVRETVEQDRTMRFFNIKARLIGSHIKIFASQSGEELYSTISSIFHIFEEELEKKKHEKEKEYFLERLLKEAPF